MTIPVEFDTSAMKDYLIPRQGQDVSIDQIRSDNNIQRDTKAWKAVPNILFQLEEQKLVSYKSRGVYRVVKRVEPVQVLRVDPDKRPPFPLAFPRDFSTGYPMDFEDKIVVREGDLVLISGVSNFGKTCLCLNFAGENIDRHPVLMGNEYTIITQEEGKLVNKPAPDFSERIDSMSIDNAENGGWVNWWDDNDKPKFSLLPVRGDYAEHIVRDRINIIDWINISEHYNIGNVLESLKREVGRGIIIAAIQKAPGAEAGRGGQFTKDFAQLEILIDGFGKNEVLLTLGKVKKATEYLLGRSWAYSISQGVKINNFIDYVFLILHPVFFLIFFPHP